MDVTFDNQEQVSLRSPSDVYELMRLILEQEKRIDCTTKEHFWVISLNTQKKILNIELIGMGSIKSVPATPIEVFSLPVHKKASSVVFVHNHPSGSLIPSEADKDVTNRLIQAGLILDIEVDDHLIITDRSYYSFVASGLLKQLAFDNKYALTFIREKQFKKEIAKKTKEFEEKGEKQGMEKGAKTTKMEIAKEMLIKGMDLELIKELTGVTPQWLGRLKNELSKSI